MTVLWTKTRALGEHRIQQQSVQAVRCSNECRGSHQSTASSDRCGQRESNRRLFPAQYEGSRKSNCGSNIVRRLCPTASQGKTHVNPRPAAIVTAIRRYRNKGSSIHLTLSPVDVSSMPESSAYTHSSMAAADQTNPPKMSLEMCSVQIPCSRWHAIMVIARTQSCACEHLRQLSRRIKIKCTAEKRVCVSCKNKLMHKCLDPRDQSSLDCALWNTKCWP